MNKNLEQVLKSTTIFYLSAVVGALNRLYVLPKYFSEELMGLLAVITAGAMLMAALGNLGLFTSLQKFHEEFRQKNKLLDFKAYTLKILLLGISFSFVMFFIFKDQILSFYANDSTIAKEYFHFIPILGSVLLLKGLFNNSGIIERKTSVSTFFMDLWDKLVIVTLVFLFGQNLFDLNIFYTLLIGLQLLATYFLYAYVKRKFGFNWTYKKGNITKEERKRVFRFRMLTFPAGLTGIIITLADQLMISSYHDFAAAGVYTIPLFLGGAVEMPKRAVSTISQPILASHFENNAMDKVLKLYRQSSINQGIVGLFAFVLLWICLDEIFMVIPNGEKFAIAKTVALWIGGSKVLDMLMGVNGQIILASKFFRYNLYTSIFLVIITLTFNHLLIPIYKVNGAAIASFTTVAVYNLIMFILVFSKIKIQPFNLKTIWLLLLSGSLIFISKFIPTIHYDNLFMIILGIGVKSAIFGGTFLLFTYIFNLSEEVNNLIKMGLNKLKRK
jgi:O-antigen/teichoic acid export membrane protein